MEITPGVGTDLETEQLKFYYLPFFPSLQTIGLMILYIDHKIV